MTEFKRWRENYYKDSYPNLHAKFSSDGIEKIIKEKARNKPENLNKEENKEFDSLKEFLNKEE